MEKDYFDQLIEQYSKNELSKEKQQVLDEWFESIQHPSEKIKWTAQEKKNIKKMILVRTRAVKKMMPLWKKLTAAAVVLLVGTVAFLWFETREDMEAITVPKQVEVSTIKPGEDRGILYQDEQEQVQLNALKKDTVYFFGDISIERIADNEVKVMAVTNAKKEIQHIRAPKGGNFIVRLEDGSRLTLNANSSISFPSSFDDDLRQIQADGEVFFEVEKDKLKRPFVVQLGANTIKVLGTKFNVNYTESEGLRTALFEGAVLVSNSKFEVYLKPGKELVVDQTGNYSVKSFVTEQVRAWKEGYFSLDNKNIADIMDEVANWYDVEIDYANANLDIRYRGSISKYSDINTVLDILSLAKGNSFEVKGRRVIVK